VEYITLVCPPDNLGRPLMVGIITEPSIPVFVIVPPLPGDSTVEIIHVLKGIKR
jgi:hypothetical protein